MKFTCEKTQLVSAISVASRTVAQKSAITGLEGILVRAGVKVMLTGYNLETGITVSVDADVQENGACIMPARLFFDIVRKLPDDTVSIQVDENFKVSIKGGISSFTITALSADDYPELPDVDSEKGIRVPQCELKAMISGTIFAVSENQARPIHTGILFEVDNDSITSVAVDGYRLALRREPVEGYGGGIPGAHAQIRCARSGIKRSRKNPRRHRGPRNLLSGLEAHSLYHRRCHARLPYSGG